MNCHEIQQLATPPSLTYVLLFDWTIDSIPSMTQHQISHQHSGNFYINFFSPIFPSCEHTSLLCIASLVSIDTLRRKWVSVYENTYLCVFDDLNTNLYTWVDFFKWNTRHFHTHNLSLFLPLSTLYFLCLSILLCPLWSNWCVYSSLKLWPAVDFLTVAVSTFPCFHVSPWHWQVTCGCWLSSQSQCEKKRETVVTRR